MALNRGCTYREQVGAAAAGLSVLTHLTATRRHSSPQDWSDRLRRGEVELDGAPARAEAVLRPGQLLVWHRPPWEEPDVPLHYDLIYQDEAMLAMDKPAGLPTMAGGGFLAGTLLSLVRADYPEAAPMHRLGRHTSGIVLFARTHAAAAALARAWRNHEVRKQYRALASGVAAFDRLEIDAPVGPVAHPLLEDVHAASASGKPSHSVACVLERRADSTLFQVNITTGRPHQIRIHLASAGHPLVGDPLYGVGGGVRDHRPGLPGDGGYFLHAERLEFLHPLTHAPMELHTPPIRLPAPLRDRSLSPGAPAGNWR
jgi:23S rRNA pseudouridine1911/1915/1917 synthase